MLIIIMKFGGTSVANLNRIKKVAQIVKSKIIEENKSNYRSSSNEDDQ